MKPRRWFSGPKLLQWKQMSAVGDYELPFAFFPYEEVAWRGEWRKANTSDTFLPYLCEGVIYMRQS